jgi:SAM-dependent methyltransferase
MTAEKNHYSYSEYAKRDIAEGFDQLRFGGPIGTFLRDYQQEQLDRWLPEVKGRKILDIGAGTGRTAIPLAEAGAQVVAADASDEMLRVARSRAEECGVSLNCQVADVMDLPFSDRQFDTIMVFRVLMHVIDWKKAVSEICRCSADEIIFDFPPRYALAALIVPYRAVKAQWDSSVQRFRVFSLNQMRQEFARHGFVFEEIEKLWFWPIALHKKIGSRKFTLGLEKAMSTIGLTSLFGAPVTIRAKRK